jgi:hypothetical protein
LDLKVIRADKKTPLLSRDEERLLSAIPRGHATNARKIRLATRMPENKWGPILERLITSRFVEALEGFKGDRLIGFLPPV